MTQADALRLIKTLRDVISDQPETAEWIHKVCFHLDEASDVIEFPHANGDTPLADVRLG